MVEGTAGGKNRETVTVALCLVFKGCVGILVPPLLKSINSLLPLRKKAVKSGNHDINYMSLCSCKFRDILFKVFK